MLRIKEHHSIEADRSVVYSTRVIDPDRFQQHVGSIFDASIGFYGTNSL
jgi:hypothetical protein